jgi:hypothetical protein
MKMMAITKKMMALAAGFLLLLFTTFVHIAAAAPMQSHEAMGGMEHNHTTSVVCATLCMSAVVKREGVLQDSQREQDDDLEPTPVTPQLSHVFFESLYPANFPKSAPPSKVPLYKMYGVLLS